jgi:hypothetical protein
MVTHPPRARALRHAAERAPGGVGRGARGADGARKARRPGGIGT